MDKELLLKDIRRLREAANTIAQVGEALQNDEDADLDDLVDLNQLEDFADSLRGIASEIEDVANEE